MGSFTRQFFWRVSQTSCWLTLRKRYVIYQVCAGVCEHVCIYCILCSLSDSQNDYLINLKMRHVFETLKLLTKWMREGMYDFCALPFSLKTELSEEDRDVLCSIEKEAEGKGKSSNLIPCNDCVLCIAASVLSEIKFVTEQLMKCEGEFACATEVSENFSSFK